MVKINSEQSKRSAQFKFVAYALSVIMIAGCLIATSMQVALNWPLIVIFSLCIVGFLIASQSANNRFLMLGTAPLMLDSKVVMLGIETKGQIVINQPHFEKFNTAILQILAPGYESGLNEIWSDTLPLKIEFDGDITLLDFSFTLPTQIKLHSGTRCYLRISYVENMQEVKRTYRLNVRDPKVRML
ncbi:hypothetical protein AN214_01893 [Pseudoalteromonas sp. P1-9]|uniref:hypothetical protein n=1 Tax=Pseudoalteromonas sp. P1-9 TaxID=1710354 RepID=UPI0006D5EB04|nr:hypothetical protein [Pseudoalteromonas sp. P1-9]KPV96084.1 hypothetical protein AN214_01893 [Pseudoalteromonas sp. P1-9]